MGSGKPPESDGLDEAEGLGLAEAVEAEGLGFPEPGTGDACAVVVGPVAAEGVAWGARLRGVASGRAEAGARRLSAPALRVLDARGVGAVLDGVVVAPAATPASWTSTLAGERSPDPLRVDCPAITTTAIRLPAATVAPVASRRCATRAGRGRRSHQRWTGPGRR